MGAGAGTSAVWFSCLAFRAQSAKGSSVLQGGVRSLGLVRVEEFRAEIQGFMI